MPPFLRGRLFWKILSFFFLAQAVTVIGIGLVVWAALPEGESFPPPPPVLASPPREAVSGEWPLPRGVPPESAGERGGERLPPRPPGPPVMHLAAGTVASLVVAALLAAYIARPVRRLSEALKAGASGQLTSDLADAMGHRRDELADLCRDFDRMAHHIDQLMQGQRRLMHDVSHEMRSPLARLSAIVGLVRQQPERLEECLKLLEHESARMDRLVSELLTLSRLESGLVGPGQEVFDLAEVLADVVADAAPEAGQTACRIDLDAGAEVLVRGDAEMLHRVFDNLLRNALAYAASGGWVGIRVELDHEAVQVNVEDRGPGVLSSDLARLFEPFFRGSQAPARRGHGLGLAIARQIVTNHGGNIVAENRREGGLRVVVRLPRASSEETTASD